jgi:hypothetical protein
LQWVSIIAARQRRRLIGGAAAVNLRTLPVVPKTITITHNRIIVAAESYEILNHVSEGATQGPNQPEKSSFS